MNSRVMQRLIWKDARTLRPLMIAVPCMIVAFNLLLALFSTVTQLDSERIGIAYSIWTLLPMLVAYGAPAMLIGGEEESGSLAWLRTLPAGWRSITASKFLVAIACLLLAWAVSSACLTLFLTSLSESTLAQIEAQQGLPESFTVLFLAILALSVSILIGSFTTAYWFRSPITALLICVPLVIAALYGYGFAIEFLFNGDQLRQPPQIVADALFWKFTLLAVIGLLGLLSLCLFAAWRRLTWPDPSFALARRREAAANAYRPPRTAATSKLIAAMVGYRPSRWFALLWTHLHPIRWHLALLMIVAVFGIFQMGTSQWGQEAFGAMLCGFVLCMFASLTFYGDSVKQRCRFLYDRGISPTMIWLTRVVPMLALTVGVIGSIIAVLACHDWMRSGDEAPLSWQNLYTVLLSIGIAAFSLSQLVSQWSPRATLAFFAGPVFVSLAAFFVAAWLTFYTNSAAILLLSSAVLLFTSWKLMPHWLAGQTGQGYVGPFAAAIAIAVLLPFVVLLATRWITMPDADLAWRQRILSTTLPTPDPGQERIAILDPAYLRRSGTMGTESPIHYVHGKIAAELADTDSIGEQVSFHELIHVITGLADYQIRHHRDRSDDLRTVFQTPKVYPSNSRSATDLQFDAVRVLLKWSRQTREQAVVGTANVDVLFGVAENADLLALRLLKAYVDRDGITDEIKQLVDALPPTELVQQSRQNSLIRSWREYQSGMHRFAGQWSHQPVQWWLAVERTRADRSVDQLCQSMLDQWSSDHAFQSPESLERLQRLEHDAYLDQIYDHSSQQRLSDRIAITADVDRLRKELLAQLPHAPSTAP